MQPASLYFALFLGVTTLLYFGAPFRFRWVVLLAASAYFYLSWSPAYIFFLGLSILLNFGLGIQIERLASPKRRRTYLLIGLAANLLVLFFFRYIGLLTGSNAYHSFRSNAPSDLPGSELLLPPIGISFYTLQVIAYLLDIYKGLQKSETHIGRFALFTSFFPLQLSGPIERAKHLLPQLAHPKAFDAVGATNGLRRIAWGVFKKLVIADRLAIYTDQVFNHPGEFTGFPIMLAILFFAFQIYCDFSGYTDIVLGAAQMLGYELTENFRYPYFADSIQKFWSTWHVSLSNWLRDYIFFPVRRAFLQRQALPRWAVQIAPPMITMLVSGIWHGAGWTFIIWGLLHGAYLTAESLARPRIDRYFDALPSRVVTRFYYACQTMLTFLLVCFAWVFFRANTVRDAFTLLANLARLDLGAYATAIRSQALGGLLEPFVFQGGLDQGNLLLAILLIVFLLVVDAFSRSTDLSKRIDSLPVMLRWSYYVAATFAIVFLSVDAGTKNFIYFQF